MGIAGYRIRGHNVIRIKYRNKAGELLYPEPLYMSGDQIRSYPHQVLGSGVSLYLVPIRDLEVLES